MPDQVVAGSGGAAIGVRVGRFWPGQLPAGKDITVAGILLLQV